MTTRTDINAMTVSELRDELAERCPDLATSSMKKAELVEHLVDAMVNVGDLEAENDNTLSVADIARELSIDPKIARSRLRRAKYERTGKRYGRVERDSDEHKALIELITPKPKTEKANEADAA